MPLMLLSLTFSGCHKSKDSEPQKPGDSDGDFVMLIYPLSEEDKTLLNHYYNNPTISYSDQDNQELVFQTDSLYSTGLFDRNLKMDYNCMSESFPYSFQIALSSSFDSTLWLNIRFFSPANWTFNSFTILPKRLSSLDTIFENGNRLKFDYYDSLTLRTEHFNKVFYITNQEEEASYLGLPPIMECYYTNETGLVAFKTDSDKLWIRKSAN